MNKAKAAFERDFVQETQDYLQKQKEQKVEKMKSELSSNAMSAAMAKALSKQVTMSMGLSAAYHRLKAKHPAHVKANFPMVAYGEDVESEKFKKQFPQSFKRHFFRVVKVINDKKGPKLSYADVKKRLKHMPPAFIVNSAPGNCSLHTKGSCPKGVACPYVTHNKKIIGTISRKIATQGEIPTHRQRIFYREDMKEKIKQVFMS